MFKFLKEKIKQAVSSITKKVEEDQDIETTEEVIVQEQPKETKKQEKKAAPKKKEEPTITKEEQQQQKPVSEEKKKLEIRTGLELPAVLQEDFKRIKAEQEMQGTVVTPGLVPEEKKEKKKGFFSKLFSKREATEEILEEKETTKEPEPAITKEEATPDVREQAPEEKKGFFASIKEKIVTKKISSDKFEELFFDLEFALLENNVAYEVVHKIKEDMKAEIVDKPLPRGDIEKKIEETLKKSLQEILNFETLDLIQLIKNKKDKPYVIVFVGVNGAGKTTTIARLTHYLKKNGISCLLAAGDTWRAASIEQLEEHGKKLGVKVIKHDYGADAAAVAHDAISSGKANHVDVVLIDTAGRQHSNENLMREMEKIIRVAKPDMKIFIGEAIVGNDAVQQSQEFNRSIGLDGIILTKSDIDEKGGAMISVSYVTKKPILFLGIGQNYEDLEPFSKEKIMKNLGF
ncbi:MAG TPA: signal recognition particle-docking protein FtsY [Candidatus Nanoarchaeia archaeon]|nr:signal recognition particle-docking protein FtsY [Candidatus Nanoarchaeia archaeon]